MFVLIKECFGETNFVHFLTAKALDFVDFLHLKITKTIKSCWRSSRHLYEDLSWFFDFNFESLKEVFRLCAHNWKVGSDQLSVEISVPALYGVF
jgi:hypothetical protein